MPDPNTETTQTQPETTTTVTSTTVTAPPVTTEQGTVGDATSTPPKKEEVQTATTQQSKLAPEEVQKRVDRMYARLQEERKKRLAAEALSRASKPVATTTTEDDGGDDDKPKIPPQLTESDVEAVMERKEREKRFMASEIRVFEQHPDALNEDGSFNMNSPFVQKYIEIGKNNPMLAAMENGPEMAAALVDKELGLDVTKGRVEEARRLSNQNINTFTTTSTTSVPPNTHDAQLSNTQKKIARHMGMSDKDYIDNQSNKSIKQKSWEVKVR